MSETPNPSDFSARRSALYHSEPGDTPASVLRLEAGLAEIDADERFIERAESLIDSLQRAVGHVRTGYSINSLGVVQSQGGMVDIAAAERQKAYDTAKMLRHYLAKMEPQEG